ncbi:MAG: class I SAM-dependent methyltransferase [Xanthomonadales bacterium]|nr:class I SAM-dependent methyltransferase [Xanthomonadales bacterium]
MKSSDQSGFKDHFSGHAAQYARYRPVYPAALYDWLAEQSPASECAWDAATGNGQAAVELAKRFSRVIATDGSATQIAQAIAAENIQYRVETAEANSLGDHSADLVTVAQAYHWFDHAAFLPQLERVIKPGGLFAIWTYALAEISTELDQVVRDFYAGPIADYWLAERLLVEQGYSSLRFPWPELAVPDFLLQLNWSLDDLLGYLRTWSAVQRCHAATGSDPVAAWQAEFARAWGEASTRIVTWPMRVRAFRVE